MKILENKESLITGMVDRIAHRGPDDDGFTLTTRLVWGMRRLSIIDLKSGQQPIESKRLFLPYFF